MEENLASVAQRLAKITKVSSGAIASQGIYHLGSDIHAKVVQQHAQKEVTEANAVTKQAEKEEVRKGKAQSAWGKWRNGTRNKATISDLRILVQDLKEGSNSPLKKDRTGLVSWCKVRELQAVRLKQGRGDLLSHYDMRVLLKAVGYDTTEEALMSKSIGKLEAELQEAHQGLDIDNEDGMTGSV